MKKILFILLLPVVIFAKSDRLSQIPPATEIYINLEPEPCGVSCLLELFKNGLYHSFLARFEPQNDEQVLQAYANITGKSVAKPFEPSENAKFKIAVIIPEQSIKGYTKVVSNAVISYIIRQKAKIQVKFYNIGNESFESIQNALQSTKQDGISYIIAPFTQVGVVALNQSLDSSQIAFVPTLHISSVQNLNSNIIFGGIDYKAQIAKLLEVSNTNLAAISDGSQLGTSLNDYIRQLGGELAYEDEIRGSKSDLKAHINARLNNLSLFLNLPILKAALLSSQLRVYDVKPAMLLSTQINYLPSIFKLTQSEDRSNLYIANSLSNVDSKLDSANEILGQNLNYNWIAYSTSVGVEYFYTNFLEQGAEKIFSQEIKDSQVSYDVRVMKAGEFAFKEAN